MKINPGPEARMASILRILPLVLLSGVLVSVPRLRAEPPAVLSVRPEANVVGCYEKLELRVDLRATHTNPFDPDEVDLSAEFTAPSGKAWRVWGFYNTSSWAALWMVRFTPTETGVWRYVVKVKDREGEARSPSRSFEVTESTHSGFIGIAPNRRYLRHTDGSSFYGIGLWYNDSYEQFGQGQITELGLDELKELGVNFISFFHTPLETMGSGLGRYDQNRCGRLDELFSWCEARDIRISWNIWFHSYISEAVWGGGNARYRNNPYRAVSRATDFFGNAEAWRYQQKLYRYMIARWGYSRALFLWFIVDEINGTEGWQKGDQQVAEAWCQNVHDYFKHHDPYGRPTTGTQSGGIGQWWPGGYRIFDIAAREIYEAQGHPMPKSGKPSPEEDDPLRFSYRNYASQVRALWDGFNKPAIIGECGWDHTYYEPGMPGYLAMYHNALWAGLANGLCATPFWWAHSSYLNDSVLTRQLQHFGRFVRDIDFAGSDFAPINVKAGEADAWAMTSEELIFGWLANPRSSAARETFTLSGVRDGPYAVRLYRTWRGQYLPEVRVNTVGGELAVTVPELRTSEGRAQHIGPDIAFKIRPIR